MAVVISPELQKKFDEWIWAHRLTVRDIAAKCNFSPSEGTFRNWRRLGMVSKSTVREFLEAFPEEDPDDWLRYFDKQTAAA